MTNSLYDALIVHSKESEDGDTPTVLWITQENNCIAVWLTGFKGTRLLKWFNNTALAIEYGVDQARELRRQHNEGKDLFQ